MAKTKTPEEIAKKAKAREEYLAERKRRNHLRKQKRHDNKCHERWRRKKYWVCDMGYTDCNLRGFCNGDC